MVRLMHVSDKIALICTSLLIGSMAFLAPTLIKKETHDVRRLNDEYGRIKGANPDCIKYLQAINGMPTWRKCLLWTFGTVTITFLFLSMVASIPHISSIALLSIGYWFSSILMFTILYKMFNHHNWHYMCRGGCVHLETYRPETE